MIKRSIVAKKVGKSSRRKAKGSGAADSGAVKPPKVASINAESFVEEAVGDDWPKWKSELLEILDQHTQVPLVQQLKNGVLKEDISLFLNLNLSTQWLQSKAFHFNQLIKKHSTASRPKTVSTNDLSECDTLAQLLKLIGSRM